MSQLTPPLELSLAARTDLREARLARHFRGPDQRAAGFISCELQWSRQGRASGLLAPV